MTTSVEVEAETPGLDKALKSRHVAMIAIGGIIGAGLFVGSSAAIAAAGPAITISYALAGFIILLVMRMLGEMAMANPEIGSFTDYGRLGLGNWAGFISGWLYWYFWVVVVAIEAIAGAAIIHEWLPMIPVWQIGLALMVVMTIVNLMSASSYGEFEFWFASIKVAAIISFIVIAGGYAFGIGSGAMQFGNLFAHGGFAPNGWGAVLAGVTAVIFSLCGAEIATIAAAESKESSKVIAKMTGSVVVRILLFYVLSITVILSVVPWVDIVPGQSPFVAALNKIGVPGAALMMNFIVLTAVLSCLNSGVYVTSRVLFTLSRHGDAPKALVALNRRKVPARAILLGSAFGFAAVIAAYVSPQLIFSFLVNASGALMLIIYLIIALAQIRYRRKLEREAPEKLVFKMWFFPYASYFVVAAVTIVLVAMLFEKSLATQLYASLACTAVAGAGYLYRRRRAG